jgi:hypothetical protein
MSELKTRKAARTRLALASALSTALTNHTFAEIRIKGICADAEVSEATFFNYFGHVANTCERKPGVFRELMVWIARGGNLDPDISLAPLEKQLAFPDLEGIADVPVKGLDAWLLAHLEVAVTDGELPPNTLIPLMLTSLLTLMLGAPMTLLSHNPQRVAGSYREQLRILWTGARAASTGS